MKHSQDLREGRPKWVRWDLPSGSIREIFLQLQQIHFLFESQQKEFKVFLSEFALSSRDFLKAILPVLGNGFVFQTLDGVALVI